MKHRRAGAALLTVAAMTLSVACGGHEGELTGTVFVVTRGGENIKLALVPVNVFPEDLLRSHVEKRRAQAQTELIGVRQAIKEAEASSRAASQEAQRLEKEFNRKLDDAVRTGSMKSSEQAASAADKARATARTSAANVDTAKQRERSLSSWAYYMDGLPMSPPSAKTDADGKFTVRIPRSGRMGLAAAAKRTLPNGSQEDYYWLVWVSLDGKQTGQVMLSNDNLWGTSSGQVVASPGPGGVQ